ncbi:MAG: HAMP domain-containing sensor histidine kinase [Alphaproteobacteria bacterium]
MRTVRTKIFRTSGFRFALLYLAPFGASVLVLFGFIYWTSIEIIDAQTNAAIEAEIKGLSEQYRAQGLARLRTIVAERSTPPGDGDNIYLLADPAGNPLAGNLRAWPRDSRRDGDWLYVSALDAAKNYDRREFRARTFLLRGNFRLLVGRDIRARSEFRSAMIQSLGWALAITVALGVAGGTFMSRRMLRRVDGVAAASREIMRGDLSRRMPVSESGDEFDRLSETLNEMLEEIEQLLMGMRAVTDSVTHDLKSPLTRLKATLELALQQHDVPGAQSAVTRAISEVDGVLATFDALIAIARAEAGTGKAAMESVDISAVVRDMADLYRPLAEHKGISFGEKIDESCVIQGHPQFLSQAVGNLLDNAVKFSPQGGNIGIELSLTPASVRLTISDAGPGIAATDRARVLKRFVRLDESRSSAGSGLGLSLVAGVAKLHGAELQLSDSDSGGLSVQLTFDLAAPGRNITKP